MGTRDLPLVYTCLAVLPWVHAYPGRDPGPAHTLIVCSFTFWDGGWASPVRFVAVIPPMLSGYAAPALQRAPLIIARGFAVAAAIYAGVVAAHWPFTPHGGFSPLRRRFVAAAPLSASPLLDLSFQNMAAA